MDEWVQSKTNKNGEKWQVVSQMEDPVSYLCRHPFSNTSYLRLPKSEYDFCDPPEVWEDVTAACSVVENSIFHLGVSVSGNDQYRVCGTVVNMIGPGIPNGGQKQWAFVVKRRKLD